MTIRDLIEEAALNEPADHIAYRFFRNGAWQKRSYAQFFARVRRLCCWFGRKGAIPRETKIAVVLENSPEWLECYSAIVSAALIAIPIDPKLTASETAYILGNSGASMVVTDTRHLSMLETILEGLPAISRILVVDHESGDLPPCAGRPCTGLDAAFAAIVENETGFYDRNASLDGDLASIIYTSGTTGFPKGAMLTHANFVSDAQGCLELINRFVTRDDDFLIVLPLFHAFSFTTNFMVALCRHSHMSFVQSLRTVGDDLKVLRPSVIMAVPLMAEKLYAKVESALKKSLPARVLLGVGLTGIVGKKVLKNLGGNIRLMIVGGAKCPPAVLEGFTRLGINIIEGYGLTEAAPVVCVNPVDAKRIGSIGRAIGGIEVRIADEGEGGVGELQVKGPIVMKGYYENPGATADAFAGEWLRTGDLASIDEEGYIWIRGRAKALIVNREGKNIYPEEVEQCIARSPLVYDVVVIGYQTNGDSEGEKVGAIVTPDLEMFRQMHGPAELPFSEIETMLRKAVQEACRELAAYKHPRKVEIRAEALERTSTQKVRRCVYQGQLDEK